MAKRRVTCGWEEREVGERPGDLFVERLCSRGSAAAAWLDPSVQQAQATHHGRATGEQLREQSLTEDARGLTEQEAIVVGRVPLDADLLAREVRAESAADEQVIRARLTRWKEDWNRLQSSLSEGWLLPLMRAATETSVYSTPSQVNSSSPPRWSPISDVRVVSQQERLGSSIVRVERDAVVARSAKPDTSVHESPSACWRCTDHAKDSGLARPPDVDLDATDVLQKHQRGDREFP